VSWSGPAVEERERYDAKLSEISRVAASIFADKGYHRASIRDIAAATGVSLSGLYYYFSSKEEFLFHIQRRCFETLIDVLGTQLEAVSSPTERLRTFISVHLHFFVENMKEMKVLSHEAAVLTGEYREIVSTVRHQYTDLVRDIVADVLLPDGLDTRVATFALFGMLNWIYTWYRPGKDVPVDRLADDMFHIFLRGTASPLTRGDGGAIPAIGDSTIWKTP
jgi:AcrR family transcriptional regulator